MIQNEPQNNIISYLLFLADLVLENNISFGFLI